MIIPEADTPQSQREQTPASAYWHGTGGLLAAGDGGLAVLQGLAQGIDDVGVEQRELVEVRHPVVARLAAS